MRGGRGKSTRHTGRATDSCPDSITFPNGPNQPESVSGTSALSPELPQFPKLTLTHCSLATASINQLLKVNRSRWQCLILRLLQLVTRTELWHCSIVYRDDLDQEWITEIGPHQMSTIVPFNPWRRARYDKLRPIEAVGQWRVGVKMTTWRTIISFALRRRIPRTVNCVTLCCEVLGIEDAPTSVDRLIKMVDNSTCQV